MVQTVQICSKPAWVNNTGQDTSVPPSSIAWATGLSRKQTANFMFINKYLASFNKQKQCQFQQVTEKTNNTTSAYQRKPVTVLLGRDLFPLHIHLYRYSILYHYFRKNRGWEQCTCHPHLLQYRLAVTHGKHVHNARATGSVQSHILECCEMGCKKFW